MEPPSEMAKKEQETISRGLRHTDKDIVEVLASFGKVAVFELQEKSPPSTAEVEWVSARVEGPLFVVRRCKSPPYGFLVQNRLDLQGLFEPLQSLQCIEHMGHFVTYLTVAAQLKCIWFCYEADVEAFLHCIEGARAKSSPESSAVSVDLPVALCGGLDRPCDPLLLAGLPLPLTASVTSSSTSSSSRRGSGLLPDSASPKDGTPVRSALKAAEGPLPVAIPLEHTSAKGHLAAQAGIPPKIAAQPVPIAPGVPLSGLCALPPSVLESVPLGSLRPELSLQSTPSSRALPQPSSDPSLLPLPPLQLDGDRTPSYLRPQLLGNVVVDVPLRGPAVEELTASSLPLGSAADEERHRRADLQIRIIRTLLAREFSSTQLQQILSLVERT
eukprot:RCo028458